MNELCCVSLCQLCSLPIYYFPPDRTIIFCSVPLPEMTSCVSQHNWLWPWTVCLSVMNGQNTSGNILGTLGCNLYKQLNTPIQIAQILHAALKGLMQEKCKELSTWDDHFKNKSVFFMGILIPWSPDVYNIYICIYTYNKSHEICTHFMLCYVFTWFYQYFSG